LPLASSDSLPGFFFDSADGGSMFVRNASPNIFHSLLSASAGFLHGLLFNSEDGGDIFVQI
jgi:hypothetical protein